MRCFLGYVQDIIRERDICVIIFHPSGFVDVRPPGDALGAWRFALSDVDETTQQKKLNEKI